MITDKEFNLGKKASLRKETYHPATATSPGRVRQRGGSLWWVAQRVPSRVPGRVGNATVTSLVRESPIPTACWEWNASTERHIISISDRLDEAFFDPTLPRVEAVGAHLVKSAIAHEACHAAYTSLYRASINDRLAAKGLKFRFHNLVEDCRIEWKYLKERGKDHRFGWLRLNQLPHMTQPTNVASTYLWQLKSREPALFKTVSSAAAPLKWTGLPRFISGVYEGELVTKVIQKFYSRFVTAVDEEALIPIEREWVDIFGEDVETITGVADHDESGGLKAAAAAAAAPPPSPGGGSAIACGISACVMSDGLGAGGFAVKQGDFAFPGDVPFDPGLAHGGMSPISVFFGA